MAEVVLGNIFVRQNKMRKGEVVRGHKHNFDHVSYVRVGTFEFRTGTAVRQIRSTQDRSYVLIRAGVEHEIICLEDGIFDCVYSHRTPQGEVAEEYTGWDDAYV